MYMTSIRELEKECIFKIEQSINSKLKTDIMGIQLYKTEYPGIMSLTILFKNSNGSATGLLQLKDDCYQLLAPLKVVFTKKEEKNELKKLS